MACGRAQRNVNPNLNVDGFARGRPGAWLWLPTARPWTPVARGARPRERAAAGRPARSPERGRCARGEKRGERGRVGTVGGRRSRWRWRTSRCGRAAAARRPSQPLSRHASLCALRCRGANDAEGVGRGTRGIRGCARGERGRVEDGPVCVVRLRAHALTRRYRALVPASGATGACSGRGSEAERSGRALAGVGGVDACDGLGTLTGTREDRSHA